MFIKQNRGQEIYVRLETIEHDCVYSICDSAIDYPSLFGGEWVNATEYDGKILRLSISASYNYDKDGNMSENKYNYDWRYNPQHMENYYPYGNFNTCDDLSTMLNYD